MLLQFGITWLGRLLLYGLRLDDTNEKTSMGSHFFALAPCTPFHLTLE